MTNEISAWESFSTELRKKITPALNPPASESSIAEMESHFGHRFPAALRELYLTNDGETESRSIFGLHLLPLSAAKKWYDTWQGIIEEDMSELDEPSTSEPAGAIELRYVSPHWWPIIDDDGANHIGIDMQPGPNGTVGQIINFGRDEDDKSVIAANITDFWALLTTLLDHPITTVNDNHISMSQRHPADVIREYVRGEEIKPAN